MTFFLFVVVQFVVFGLVACIAIRSFHLQRRFKMRTANRHCPACAIDQPYFACYCGRCGRQLP